MAHVVHKNDLPGNHTSRQFEGHLHHATYLSFFISDTPPGKGPSLHTHPYEEIFIIEAGTLTFVVGTETIDATPGQIVIVPPETPHKFTNTGAENARHIDLHANAQMVTTWLED